MITVNGMEFPWQQGLTVRKLLQRKGYTFPAIVVIINGCPIAEGEFDTTEINDGDNVQAIHLIAGG